MGPARILASLAAALLLAAVRTTSLGAHDPAPTKATWTRDVGRIFAARCVSCHIAGGPSPMPLATYEQARPWAAAIREQVLTRKMPIWRAARGYGDFSNDPSLSPRDIALVTAWVDGGAPQGDLKDLPAGKPSAGPSAARQTPGPKPREVQLACGETPIAGRLLGVSPQLDDGSSASILAILPNGGSEIVAWIRDYDSKFPTTYWLRRPIQLPRGSRLATSAAGPCSVVVTLARPATPPKTPVAATSARPRSRTAR